MRLIRGIKRILRQMKVKNLEKGLSKTNLNVKALEGGMQK
jgi:hypothetical protein